MARWYNGDRVDPLGEARPTRTRSRAVTGEAARNWELYKRGNPFTWHQGSSMGKEFYQDPYVTPPEILDQMQEQFQQQPLKYTTDPLTGNVVASKTMQKPELPDEMAGTRWRNLFGEGDLTSKWILPAGALSGPNTIQRAPPPSDYQSQSAYNMGVSNVGQRAAMLNPATHWPESAFRLPMRAPAGGNDPYAKPEPVFGGTVDYTTGKRYAPPSLSGYSDPYGKFNAGLKTPPGYGKQPAIGGLKPSPKTTMFKPKETEYDKYSSWKKERDQAKEMADSLEWQRKKRNL